MKRLSSRGISVVALSVLHWSLGACALTSAPPSPGPIPVPEPSPTPSPTPKHEAWMGPQVKAAPSVEVSSSQLSPLVDQNGKAVETFSENQSHPKALLLAHDLLLSRSGRSVLTWSDKLAQTAAAQATQLKLVSGPYSFCARNYTVNYSAPGEAVHIAPARIAGEIKRGDVNAQARQIAAQWRFEKVGAFDTVNSKSTRMGCAKVTCPQTSEIWVCRFS